MFVSVKFPTNSNLGHVGSKQQSQGHTARSCEPEKGKIERINIERP